MVPTEVDRGELGDGREEETMTEVGKVVLSFGFSEDIWITAIIVSLSRTPVIWKC